MKHVMKHIAMVALVVALAAGGYIAYQHYFVAQDDVKVQLFNIGTNSGSYDEGYNNGYNAGLAACHRN